ncbi:MAG: hypothetical protein IKC36_02480 [Clostridia bacterium]|nr:hypothetical protein [Clostridia bacterium]
MRKFLIFLLSITVMLLAVGCNRNPGGSDSNGGDFVPWEESEMERDYVYMWHRDGLTQDQNRMFFQSEEYKLSVDTKTAKIIGIANSGDDFYEMKDEDLQAVDTTFELKVGGEYYSTTVNGTQSRIIDSGRYVNRMDNISLRFNKQGLNKFARVEYVATKNFVALNYEVISSEASEYGLRLSVKMNGKSATEILGGRGVKCVDENGNGFAFIKQKDSTAAIRAFGDSVICEQGVMSFEKNVYKGFGIIIIPVKNGDEGLVEGFIASEQLTITATQVGGGEIPVNYEKTEGIYYVDASGMVIGSQGSEAGRNSYDRIDFTISNNQLVNAEPVICFYKNTNMSITGMSPMIRDASTLEPTGEQVQISKNWHKYVNPTGDALVDTRESLYAGPWFHGYYSASVPANDQYSREYTCAYGNWGGVYAASHGQLCLIGWGGNQLWDESALGSWGESVTYDPDIGLSRSMIDDVRPFLVTAPTGSNQEYNWTGNVGGANFLDYIEKSEQRLINQRTTYTTQAPNLTSVNYSGITTNGKIKSDITINLGRTNDINRNYYTIKYVFLEDVTYGRLSLFKVCADGYADNSFVHYAYGDEDGIIKEEQSSVAARNGYENGDTQNALNKQFWFGLYNSSSTDENGDVMFVVRDYKATINGKSYDKPSYRFFGTNNGTPQMSCELTVPLEAGKTIKKGSVIEMVVEYSVLPGNTETFYGRADYLLQTTALMGTASAMYQQVVGGNIVANATVGQLKSGLPVVVSADNTQTEVVAQVDISGGLGYLPITVEGLSSYKGYKLQVKQGEQWKDVDQSVKGNDFWQAHYNPGTGLYSLTYNVKNTSGLLFNTTNTYRMVKI